MKWGSYYIAKLLGGFEIAHVILVLAIITKYSQSGLTNRHLFLTSLESGNSKIKVLYIWQIRFNSFFFFFQTYFAALDLNCGTRDIHCAMLASAVAACSLSLIVAHGLQSMRASVAGVHRLSCSKACEILVPRPGIKPSSPALQAGLLTSGPSGKSLADSWLVDSTFLLCHHMAKRERVGARSPLCLLVRLLLLLLLLSRFSHV